MKKTCNGCRALVYGFQEMMCELKFETEPIYLDGRVISYKPLEQCPKPKTYEDYFLQKKLLKGGR